MTFTNFCSIIRTVVEKENRNNYDMINDLQQLCIDNNIFGMGGAIDDDNSLSFGMPIQEGKNVYQELYGEDSGLEKATNKSMNFDLLT